MGGYVLAGYQVWRSSLAASSPPSLPSSPHPSLPSFPALPPSLPPDADYHAHRQAQERVGNGDASYLAINSRFPA